jgi:carbon storage regulator
MLVLSRKKQQSVVIGNATGVKQLITITVLEICGKQVRLGVDAAGEIPVHRGEVWARINGTDNPAPGFTLRSAQARFLAE